MNNKSNRPWIITVVIVVVVILVAAGIWGVLRMMGADTSVKKSQYQALFLTNGQVYFGKLANVGGEYIELSDIYYLQVQQSVQPEEKDKEQPQVSLAKLGSELHGPEDKMMINRDQVLFWENLKNDSKVVTAIKQNQNK